MALVDPVRGMHPLAVVAVVTTVGILVAALQVASLVSGSMAMAMAMAIESAVLVVGLDVVVAVLM